MPSRSSTLNQLSWVKSLSDSLYLELIREIDEIQDTRTREVLDKIVKLTMINQELQTLGFINLLSKITENQVAIDEELVQISEFVEAIVRVHQEEARSLKKIL